MYSKPPPTASVAEVSTADSRCSNNVVAQNVGHGDRRGLQEDVLLAAAAGAKPAAASPRRSIQKTVLRWLRLQNEAQLHAQLFHAARQACTSSGFLGMACSSV